MSFEALGISTLAVCIAEMGDKTQLLALVLAARYRKPLPIIFGILIATLVNHAVSAWLGTWLAQIMSPTFLQWLMAVLFFAVALWALVPDKLEQDEVKASTYGAFLATLLAFFIVEIGDKTQVATVLLAIQYSPLWQIITGTTLGMMLANVPVVLIGAKFAEKLPLKAARYCAALVFFAMGAWVAWQAFSS
jgi:Ca2+/H+ antiporter, TMEM165/GDT1 family